jgi:hypothetical protein
MMVATPKGAIKLIGATLWNDTAPQSAIRGQSLPQSGTCGALGQHGMSVAAAMVSSAAIGSGMDACMSIDEACMSIAFTAAERITGLSNSAAAATNATA